MGSTRRKTRFFGQIFQKVPKNDLFGLFFFQNFACGAENLAETGTKTCLKQKKSLKTEILLNRVCQTFKQHKKNIFRLERVFKRQP